MFYDPLGSVYEGVNISGDTTEFDVMFVANGKNLQLVSKPDLKKGYSYVKPKCETHDFHNQLDGNGYLDPEKYSRNFIGVVQQWITTQHGSIKLRKHGVAAQIDVFDASGEIWYCVDLVPSLEIGN